LASEHINKGIFVPQKLSHSMINMLFSKNYWQRYSLLFFLLLLINSCQPSMTPTELSGMSKARLLIENQDLVWDNFEIFLRAFKQEKTLEVWGKSKTADDFKLMVNYPFCATSGELGPKRREGDRQIPEGIYHINRFNPKSKFHLSLGLNYPNEADAIHADPAMPGSDIFIHGGCETIGCIPITNPKIEILYALAQQAKAIGQQKIPVHIFPAKFSNTFYQEQTDSPYLSFWKSLYPVYKAFESNHQLPVVALDDQGSYILVGN